LPRKPCLPLSDSNGTGKFYSQLKNHPKILQGKKAFELRELGVSPKIYDFLGVYLAFLQKGTLVYLKKKKTLKPHLKKTA